MLPAVRGSAPRWDDPAESGWRVFGRIAEGGSIEQVNAELAAVAAREPAAFRRSRSTPRPAASGSPAALGREAHRVPARRGAAAGGGGADPVDRLLERCQPPAGARSRAAQGDRDPDGQRRRTGAPDPAAAHRKPPARARGGAAGLLLAIWCRDLIWAVLPEAPRLAVELDLNVLLYTGAVCIAATMLFGLVPALHATRIDVAPLLKSDDAGGGSVRRGGRLRTFFLVSQFAASTALLIVAGTFVRTVVTTHLGEQAALMDRITVASIDAESLPAAARADYWRAVRERIRQVPGVTAVTLSAQGGERTAQITVGGLGPDERVMRECSGSTPSSSGCRTRR